MDRSLATRLIHSVLRALALRADDLTSILEQPTLEAQLLQVELLWASRKYVPRDGMVPTTDGRIFGLIRRRKGDTDSTLKPMVFTESLQNFLAAARILDSRLPQHLSSNLQLRFAPFLNQILTALPVVRREAAAN